MTNSNTLVLGQATSWQGRWPLLAAALTLQTTVGGLFAWNVFLSPLRSATGWDESSLLTPYRYSLIWFVIGLLVASQVARRNSPRSLAYLGGWMLILGALIAAAAGLRLDGITLGVGVLCGLGAGIAYMAPVSVYRHWLPENGSMVVGLSTLCFGAGGLMIFPILQRVIASSAASPTEALRVGFLTLAVVFLLGVVGAGYFLPATRAWLAPRVLRAVAGIPAARTAKHRHGWNNTVVSLLRLWLFWAVFFLGSFAGLAGIQQEIPLLRHMPWNEALLTAGLCVFALGLANHLGRAAWALLARRMGRMGTFALLVATAMAASLVLTGGEPRLSAALAALALIGFGLGGFLGLMPQLAGEMLDHSHSLPLAFGMMFSAFGLCAFAAPYWLAAQRPETLLGQISLLAISSALLVGFLYLLVRPATAGTVVSQAVSRW